MKWRNHSNLKGQHAFLSASKYHWLNYTDDKMLDTYNSYLATQRGSELHAFAETCIRLGRKQPKNKDTLNMYVNDAISYNLVPEQVLYFSENCFGTADAIGFRNNQLRIHDLKTGVTPTHMEQLEIYAALFCLEYVVNPAEIIFELRIYQNNDIFISNPTADDIVPIMEKIKAFDKLINSIKYEGD